MQITRLLNRPIIGPDLHPSLGVNIQGPSLIRVPDWVPNPLGRYYLYFADHKGSYIRLAYADELTGPWRVHIPGALHLADSLFLTSPPPTTPAQLAAIEARMRRARTAISHDVLTDATTPHIASPDVHVDHAGRRIVMYFHGLSGVGEQASRVALSADGIAFTARPELVGRTYMRVFAHRRATYALAMPGVISRSADGLSDFAEGPELFNPNMRHAALLKRGDTLHVFWTQVGDAPESILLSAIDLSGDWLAWREGAAQVVLRPEHAWEGADAPVQPSIRSTAYGHVNQLRDPGVFEEDGRVFLIYAVAGESGIALAEVEGI
ncbi:MAG: hypothetical protein ABI920_18395 [Casimicrobiaceae bacterium]